MSRLVRVAAILAVVAIVGCEDDGPTQLDAIEKAGFRARIMLNGGPLAGACVFASYPVVSGSGGFPISRVQARAATDDNGVVEFNFDPCRAGNCAGAFEGLVRLPDGNFADLEVPCGGDHFCEFEVDLQRNIERTVSTSCDSLL